MLILLWDLTYVEICRNSISLNGFGYVLIDKEKIKVVNTTNVSDRD